MATAQEQYNQTRANLTSSFVNDKGSVSVRNAAKRSQAELNRRAKIRLSAKKAIGAANLQKVTSTNRMREAATSLSAGDLVEVTYSLINVDSPAYRGTYGPEAIRGGDRRNALKIEDRVDRISRAVAKQDQINVLRIIKGSGSRKSDVIFETQNLMITNVDEAQAEKFQLQETFGRTALFLFDKRPEIFTYSGTLLNADYALNIGSPPAVPGIREPIKPTGSAATPENLDEYERQLAEYEEALRVYRIQLNNYNNTAQAVDPASGIPLTAMCQWKNQFLEVYDRYLRGTQLARAKTRAVVIYDDVLREGYVLNCRTSPNANELSTVPFSMGMLVTRKVFLGSDSIGVFDVSASQDVANDLALAGNNVVATLPADTREKFRQDLIAMGLSGPAADKAIDGFQNKLTASVVEGYTSMITDSGGVVQFGALDEFARAFPLTEVATPEQIQNIIDGTEALRAADSIEGIPEEAKRLIVKGIEVEDLQAIENLDPITLSNKPPKDYFQARENAILAVNNLDVSYGIKLTQIEVWDQYIDHLNSIINTNDILLNLTPVGPGPDDKAGVYLKAAGLPITDGSFKDYSGFKYVPSVAVLSVNQYLARGEEYNINEISRGDFNSRAVFGTMQIKPLRLPEVASTRSQFAGLSLEAVTARQWGISLTDTERLDSNFRVVTMVQDMIDYAYSKKDEFGRASANQYTNCVELLGKLVAITQAGYDPTDLVGELTQIVLVNIGRDPTLTLAAKRVQADRLNQTVSGYVYNLTGETIENLGVLS